MSLTAGYIAEQVNGEVIGNISIAVTKASSIEKAGEGMITFMALSKYEPLIYLTKASIVVIPASIQLVQEVSTTVIVVKDVYKAMAAILALFNRNDDCFSRGRITYIHETALIGEGSTLGQFTTVGMDSLVGQHTLISDQVYIGNRVKIGSHCKIYPGVKIYNDTEIGDRCIIHSNAVIGSDGFGYARGDGGEYIKIPHIGRVVIEDDVEIGACTVVDRATMDETRIMQGTKLDNLIQIAHNVTIGKNNAMAAQSGVSGSTSIGDHCMVGGQSGFVGHIQVADHTIVQAKSGVSATVSEPGTKLYGYPAIEYQNYLKSYIYFKKLPDIVSRIREIEHIVDQRYSEKDHH